MGTGILVLAHPPGAGKGHNTTIGLKAWMRNVPTGADGSGFLVWTALRKEQINDQQGLELIPLSGRNSGNCRKLPEVSALAQKGYSVKDALCVRRCPYVDRCPYLKQFAQEGDFFASTPLLKATGWWERAGVVVLDEFDPTSLINHVQLSAADLAAMARSHVGAPAIPTMLRWLAQTLATTTDRTIGGVLFYEELARQAAIEHAALADTLHAALRELPSDDELNTLADLPHGATLPEYQALPPAYTAILLHQIAKELRIQLRGQRYTSRIEARNGRLELYLRVEHLITQLARADQPKIILDATANAALLQAIFPETPVQVEQPTIRGAARVVQVVGRDWAKSTLRGALGPRARRRRDAWFEDVASHIRPDRPTLIVCTLEWEHELAKALKARGHADVVVAHYGALRGSNAYKGYDVILAQVYHPNLDAIIREGRALFADDRIPLDERIVTVERTLTDATGASWAVQVPTFADSRLAALLESRREHEMAQAALRGRPLDHPDTQITLLFGMPLPGLAPTIISEAPFAPTSNAGRQAAAQAALLAATQQLLDGGQRLVSVQDLATHAAVSVVTVRAHWQAIAARLHLRSFTQRRLVLLPSGGKRSYARAVLMRRGRAIPHVTPKRRPPPASTPQGTDQAHNHDPITRVIRRSPLLPRMSGQVPQVVATNDRRGRWRPRGRIPERAVPALEQM